MRGKGRKCTQSWGEELQSSGGEMSRTKKLSCKKRQKFRHTEAEMDLQGINEIQLEEF